MPFWPSPELFALFGAVCAAVAQVSSKRTVAFVPPSLLLPLRWITSLLLFSLIVSLAGEWSSFRLAPELVYPIAATMMGPVIAWSLYTRAIERLDVAIAYPLAQCSSLGTLLMAIVFLGERPNVFTLIGAVLVVHGAFLLQGRARRGRQPRIDRIGLLLTLGSALSWSATYVFWKPSVSYFGVLETSWVRVLIPAVLLSGALLWQRRDDLPNLGAQISGQALAWCAILALFAAILSFGAQFFALQGEGGKVSIIVPIVNSSPLFVVALSTLLLGERIGPRGLLGVLSIVAGVSLVAGFGRG
jgi:drug/metabolite transporter (DMT)-like permease